nr:DsbA family protein [uncultured Actinomyces sp.]
MRIDMWLDTCDPWSYLGLRHLRSAMASFDHGDQIEVYLHAYLLDPDLEAAVDKPRIVALVESGAATLEEVREADDRMRALGGREGIRFDFDSLIIAPTSRAHRVIAAAHDADIDDDTVAGPDSFHLKVAEAIMRSHFEMGLDVSHPEVLIGCAQDIGMPPDLAALAVGDEEWASRVYSDYQMAMHMGVASVPTYVLDGQFLVDGHQTVTAFSNILATAWDNARKDRA